jgi:hypothetical protein
VLDQDVELDVTRIEMPDDRAMIRRIGDVEPDGLDFLNPLGAQFRYGLPP